MRAFIRTTLTWILVAFVGDTMIAPVIDIKGVAPDFSVIALVLLALAAGATPATAGGFMLGLVQDLSNPSLLGLQALCKSGLGFALGRLRGHLVYGVPLVEGAVVALSVFAHDFVFLLVQSNLSDERFLVPLLARTIPVALYSGLAAIPLIRLAEYLGILRQED
ncbi:rod shape-determining protein MreD [bacterium]|nr:rod shape-determining protein MreD [bacterium]